MKNSQKIYSETREQWAEKYLIKYLTLLRNAAGKKAIAKNKIMQNDEDINEFMRLYRKYDRIMHYLI